MPAASGIYTRADLRGLLGYRDARAFRARLASLMAGEAFPPPLPGLPGRWSRVQVDAWLAGVRPRTAGQAPDPAMLARAGLSLIDPPNPARPDPARPSNPTAPNTVTPIAARLAARRFQLIDGGLRGGLTST
jgi:hypothetical protein